MTRTFRYALTAVLSLVVVIPAMAQDNFPDVPDNHWAYDALKRMKSEGLLVGYPDGLFRGNRPATRYELAVAVHATYVHLRNMIDNLNSQIMAIQDQLKNTASQSDLANLRSALEALQNQVNAQGQDIADLKKMAATFEKELAALGVDVQQMKKDLGDLADRVTDLENRLPVDISGSVDFVILVVTATTTSAASLEFP
jgi:predicted RNase H-like nuclease (RuvC/YqgF family)